LRRLIHRGPDFLGAASSSAASTGYCDEPLALAGIVIQLI
jgi:hypothetical protein